jgi:hypothetical protein
MRRPAVALSLAWAFATLGCGGNLDAGTDRSHGLLPADERSPIIISQDDWSADWMGEYAVLLANSGGPPLAGIIVNATKFWGDVNANASGWRDLLTAARDSGLKNLPDVTPSPGTPLVRPADGVIEHTVGNGSPGAHKIVDLSLALSTPTRPVVVASATALTDVADAYLLDPSVVDRVVVVAALGQYQSPKWILAGPNGDMDPWADWIVVQKFRYVQAAWYDQTGDVKTTDLPSLPANPLGTWISNKQSKIITVLTASDQVALLATGLPQFTVAVQRASPDLSGGFDSTQGPPLVPDVTGNAYLVTQIAAPLAPSKLWDMLLGQHTFGP